MRSNLGLLRIVVLGCAVSMVPSTSSAQDSSGKQESSRKAFDVITVLGCVQREADYRKTIADGKGGALGTGAGATNEYVLRSVHAVSPATYRPIATAGTNSEEVYSVTGNLEHEMTRAVGHQVAVSGYIEIAKSDGTDKVKDLPRLNAAGWHIVSDRCDQAGKP